MADPFVAEIRAFPFNFAPRGWAFCNGQLLPISQNTALFSLLGTTYGGNGTSTFALVESRSSWPLMTFIISAASGTSHVNGPIWSSELAKATSPKRLTRP